MSFPILKAKDGNEFYNNLVNKILQKISNTAYNSISLQHIWGL